MAFVYRSVRQLDSNVVNTTSDTVGPATYNEHKNYQFQQSYAPFNQSSKRDGIVNEKELKQSPGPGSYQISISGLNEKVVVQSPNEDIKIVEVPKPTNVFKSKTKRFEQKKLSDMPGPGKYQLPPSIILKQQPQIKDGDQKDKIVEQIMHLNNYHPIPSIPSRKNVFGYTENENNTLELNKNPQTIYQGTDTDSVGPGQYSLNAIKGIKNDVGPTWFKYKEQRFKQQQQTIHELGPGSYELLANNKPLYQLKQSPSFASQSLRYMDQRKGMITNQFLKQRYTKSQQNLLQPISKDENDEEDDQEYIEDAIPGPGSYHNESITSSIKLGKKPEKFQFFGSSQDRFKQETTTASGNIGPADYNTNAVNSIGNKLHPIKVRNPPFLSSNTRFELKIMTLSTPGPGAYGSNVSLEDRLKTKIKKGYKGENFGILEERFKNTQDVADIPGPGSYIEPIKDNQAQQMSPTSVFKSNEKRKLYDSAKLQVPPVGAYDINYFDIKKNVIDKQQEEQDPDIQIKKPPFNSSQPRFKTRHMSQEQMDNETEDEIQGSLPLINKDKKLTDLFKKQPKANAPFNAKQKRFNYESQLNKLPGPGMYYDPSNNPWNKRTYNILYAEI